MKLVLLLSALSLAGTPGHHDAAVRRVSPSIVTLTTTASYAEVIRELEREVGEGVRVAASEQARAATYEDLVASGIVLDNEGHVVTTASFAAAATRALRAHIDGGRVVDAIVVGLDPATDLAVVRLIDARPRAAAFQPSGATLKEGATLCIVGTGPQARCTATEARLARLKLHPGAGRMHDYLRLDADPAAGAAGGAVIDGDGLVVGMVSARLERGGTLAVPAETVIEVTTSLLRDGPVARASLGVSIYTRADKDVHERGVQLYAVVDDSAADLAGLRPKDVLIEYAGDPIKDVACLKTRVWKSRPGDEVPIRFLRDGRELETVAHLQPRAAAPGTAPPILVRIQTPYLGLDTHRFTVEDRVGDETTITRGLRVIAVAAEGPAERAGLLTGDVITRVSGTAVTSPRELREAIYAHESEGRVTIDIVRDDARMTLGAEIEKLVRMVELPREHLILDADAEELLAERPASQTAPTTVRPVSHTDYSPVLRSLRDLQSKRP